MVRSSYKLCPSNFAQIYLLFIPDKLENELDHPLNAHVKTYEQIIEWCKSRTTTSRQKVLAAQRLKQVGAATGRMAPLTNEAQEDIVPVERPPTRAAPLIAALKQGGYPRERPPGGRQAKRKPGSRSPSPSSRQRSTSPSGFRPKEKCVFRILCNH